MEAGKVGEDRQDREWFLATLIMEITVEGEARNVVHRNLYLVSGCSLEEVYHKALRLGNASENTYENPAGRLVRHNFRGIAQLEALVDCEPEDGAELAFEQDIGVPENEIRASIPSRDRLRAFSQPHPPGNDVPDYSSRDALRGVAEVLSGPDSDAGE